MTSNTHQPQTRERLVSMDIAKAVTILLVVIGHSGSPFDNFIYLFHMPVFFCISGYFYKDNYSQNPLSVVKKRIFSLYLPFVAYEFVFLALHNVFYNLNIYSDKVSYYGEVGYLYGPIDYLKNIFWILTFHNSEQLLKPFWFLIVLFVITVLFSLISYFSQRFGKRYNEVLRGILIALCFIVGMILSHYNIVLSFNTNVGLVAISIFYIGYLYKRYERHIPFNPYFFFMSLALLIFDSFHGQIEMSSNTYSSPWFFLLNAVLGIYVVFGFSKFLSRQKGKLLDLLNYIGVNTIPILALQLLAFKLINYAQVVLYHYPSYMTAKFLIIDGSHGWWIAYSLVGICLPLFGVFLFQKTKQYLQEVFTFPSLSLQKLPFGK